MTPSQEQKELIEVCASCERFFPSSYMRTLYAKDERGLPVPLRFCQNCLNPQLTYIQGRLELGPFGTFPINVPLAIVFSLALVILSLNSVLGRAVGGLLGLMIALAGVLVGTGIAVGLVVNAVCTSKGSSSS
jgi:hypothetical protein